MCSALFPTHPGHSFLLDLCCLCPPGTSAALRSSCHTCSVRSHRRGVNRPSQWKKSDSETRLSFWGVEKLQGEKNPKNINETIKELFETISGDGSQLQERSSSMCRRCAVVGNSGNLRQSHYGQDIDSHDFVLRMNRAPTVGFESDVGSKTTHHFVYPESFKELPENVSMIVIPFKTLDLRWIVSALTTGTINHTYVPVPRKIKVKKEKILVYHPDFLKYVFDHWLQRHGRYPSTGILSVVFALHVCDEVNLYGFGANSKGHWHHYWENNPSAGAFRQTGVHDGDFESNITSTLAAVNKIHLFKGR
ncbi:CMP-N-acetylneuraminate-beta-galactosamide-alpha-2,3-sialyltransferase 1 isoform X2 [Alligator sinensis]|uniref:CMP-N-acetylneuraminate-beta-galactosamide-alpha-2,3-sialyltransferase 1 n=1 Tax=Alligator sinensis TaxID=38654 RepID=A0A3Q0GEH7_ALLSI|nr:CMP-N-acetylneuraminate-beta-galactosamide-alpha-2,3-sialyltransferase 1 isoform X2 [Alligator sinensis]